MRISDWSSDVCSSDLTSCTWLASPPALATFLVKKDPISPPTSSLAFLATVTFTVPESGVSLTEASGLAQVPASGLAWRSEEHTSELQSLMRISYAVFCLKKKNTKDIGKTC